MTFIVDGTSGLTFPNSTVQASAGNVLQVVQGTNSTQTTTTTSTYVTTGLTASITPKFSTSKILIIVSQAGCIKYSNNTSIALALYRNSTKIIEFGGRAGQSDTTTANEVGTIGTCYLDSPATTSSTSYTTYFASNNNNATVLLQDAGGLTQATSTITLMEIAA